MAIIAPSLLAADFGKLREEIEMINGSQADWFHVDVMDGVFVPNLSVGTPVIKSIKKYATKPLDVHLMIVDPDRYLEHFHDLGADNLTVHYEATPHLNRTVNRIKELGMKAGVSLNPHTPVHLLEEIIDDLDMVLIMTVNPGFGAQKFIPGSYQKIQKLNQMRIDSGRKFLIEVDGGVTVENSPNLIKSGVDVLVAGHTIFSSNEPLEVIRQLKAMK